MASVKHQYSKECKVYERNYDVVIIGGGTAGIAAAVSASMEGMRCLIIEKGTFLGGAATGQQVIPMMTLRLPERHMDSSPINTRIKDEMKNMLASFDTGSNDGWFNIEMLKVQHEIMADHNGIDILYDAHFIDCSVSNGHIENVIVHSRGGMLAIEGKSFIDCTGDALVALAAGVECVCGGQGGTNQAMSLRFMVGNIDILELQFFLSSIEEKSSTLKYPIVAFSTVIGIEGTPLWKLMALAENDGVLFKEDRKYFQAFSVPAMPGVISFNCPEIPNEYDVNDPERFTQAVIWGRQAVLRLHAFLKKYLRGFEKSYILSVAQPGIRESRRVKGVKYLSGSEYINYAKFDDAIARTAYPIDIHASANDSNMISVPEDKRYSEIPFRCLVIESFDNLFVAGRCISADFDAQSGLRIQPTCRSTGEAAGIGAAFCVSDSTPAFNVDGERVRLVMRKRGAFL